jgi:hypothetical protein
MTARDDASKAAKEYVDKALAERSRLGYTANVPKKSVSRAVAQAADVFGKLARANGVDGRT